MRILMFVILLLLPLPLYVAWKEGPLLTAIFATAIVFLFYEFFKAIRLSKKNLIKQYVKGQRRSRNSNKFQPTEDELKKLKLQLENDYPGRLFYIWTIRQAVTLAMEFAALQKRETLKSGQIQNPSQETIDGMSKREFTLFLENLLETQGYIVNSTPTSMKQGADLLLYKGKKRIAVQAISIQPDFPVHVSAVKNALAGQSYYSCTESWIITNSSFTDTAVSWAEKEGVHLINRKMLLDMSNRNHLKLPG